MDEVSQGQKAAGLEPMSVPSLAGLSGRLRVDVAGKPAWMLEIHAGTISGRPTGDAEDASAVLKCDSEETLAAFRSGKLNPVVAVLQGRVRLEGDDALAIKVILGLRAVFHPPPASARALQVDRGARNER